MDYAVNTYDLYRDIQQRTGGEIYIGVLGLRGPESLHLSNALWMKWCCPIWRMNMPECGHRMNCLECRR